MKKIILVILLIFAALAITLLTGVGPGPDLAGNGEYIIEAKEAAKLIGKQGVVIVDMQDEEAYQAGHVPGAVNILRGMIVVNDPYPTMLAPGDKVASVLGEAGISNDSVVLIYDDNNNLEASRLWWTMKIYGHEDVKVISGGLKALQRVGVDLSTEIPDPMPAQYLTAEKDLTMIAFLEEVEAQVEEPDPNVILLDTRTAEEFSEGTIPGAILFDYAGNIFSDGTFKPVQQILLQYKERGITADKEIIIFCAVSVRGAQTYLALYNAGYRNLKLYDGAWAEFSAVHVSDDNGAALPAPEEEIEAPGG